MYKRSDDLSRDRERSVIYERTYYVCKIDDIWIVVEVPIGNLGPPVLARE